MKFYLKEYLDGGCEYSPVGRGIDPKKLDAGFVIVDEIPQRIRDKEPGGKDYVEPVDPRDAKIAELESRLAALESKVVTPK
jgi:hypothetical protein